MKKQYLLKIEDVADVFVGGDCPKICSDIVTDECSIPIFSNGLNKEGLYGYTDISKIPGDSVTVSARGVNVGKVFYRKEPFFPIVRLISLVPIKDKIDARYLYYNLIINNAIGSGSAQPQVTAPQIKRMKLLCFDDVCYQSKVSSILFAYDSLIENNNKRIQLLEQMTENLYKEWFVRYRFPGHEETKFEHGIPKGWEVYRLGEVSKIGAGGDAPKEYSSTRDEVNNIPIYSNGITNEGLYGYTNRATKKANSVTVSARGTVGFVCLRNEPYLPIVRLLSIEPYDEKLDSFYLYLNLKNVSIDGYGTSQQQITIPYFSKKKIIIPNYNIMIQFSEIVQKYYNHRKILKEANDNLIKQRDLLLPRLMSGKLEVK